MPDSVIEDGEAFRSSCSSTAVSGSASSSMPRASAVMVPDAVSGISLSGFPVLIPSIPESITKNDITAAKIDFMYSKMFSILFTAVY